MQLFILFLLGDHARWAKVTGIIVQRLVFVEAVVEDHNSGFVSNGYYRREKDLDTDPETGLIMFEVSYNPS